jgi:hypothetical protein
MKHVMHITWVHDKTMHLESWYRKRYNLFPKQQKTSFLNSSFLQWRTYTSNMSFSHYHFLFYHTHTNTKELSLFLFFFSFLQIFLSNIWNGKIYTNKCTQRTPKKVLKKPTLNVIILFHIWNQDQSKILKTYPMKRK